MRRCQVVLLSVAAAAATLGLSGCSPETPQPPAEQTSTTSRPPAAPRPAELPPPEALVAVLQRLSDPAIPGGDKLAMIEGATAADAETLDRFATALRDNGYTPPVFAASDLAWSQTDPAGVEAVITVGKPEADGGLSIPMEFKPYQHGWQLSKETFDMLLNLGNAPITAPPNPPS